jgi:uncharacterized membrane protein YuzA (DUF378 family)
LKARLISDEIFHYYIKGGGDSAMEKMDLIALILVIIGALNWGLVGIFGLDLVNFLLGGILGGWLATLVYVLVGLAGLWMAYYVVKEYQK